MRTCIYRLVASLVAGVLLLPLSVHAETEGTSESSSIPRGRGPSDEGLNPHLGVMGGYLGEMGDATTQDASVVVEGGFRAIPELETTAQFQYTPGSLATPSGRVNYNSTGLLAKLAYRLGGSTPLIRDSYAAVKSGAVLTTLDSETTSHFAMGGALGFDISVDSTNNISLGAEGSYLATIGDNTPDQASILGAMKYWF